MAAPNAVTPTKIYLVSTALQPIGAVGSPTTILANPSGSGRVFKINTIRFVNYADSTPYDGTLMLSKNGGTAQVYGKHTVPAKAVVKFFDKGETLYLQENDTLTAYGSTATVLNVVASYEDLTDQP